MNSQRFDAIIAGGGIAGMAAAAALVEFGFRILVVEPGQDASRRLAGELIHPPGVSALAELGLLKTLETRNPEPVHGFAVFTAEGLTHLLRYGEVAGAASHGLGVGHATLREALLRDAGQLPNVTVWEGARVTGLSVDEANPAVEISREGRTEKLSAKLIVGADGCNSRIASMAGIPLKRALVSQLISYMVPADSLPNPGFGHLFLNRGALALACQISSERVRIMFDVPVPCRGVTEIREKMDDMDGLPRPFREVVWDAVASQTPLAGASYFSTPQRVAKGCVVLVGDAAGCCHPLTATGMTSSTHDALRLRSALRDWKGVIAKALPRYAALRARPERTRRLLSRILYDAFTSSSPSMKLVRDGLLRYWEHSARGRAESMALLCTTESRTSVMLQEYARVLWYSTRKSGSISPKTVQLAGEALKDLVRTSYKVYGPDSD